MSLQTLPGVWQPGVWDPNVWQFGVWYEAGSTEGGGSGGSPVSPEVIVPYPNAGQKILLSKRPDVDGTAVFDFISHLQTGESVSSAVTTATVYSGTDSAPSAVVATAVSLPVPTRVLQPLTGGVLGVVYQLLCMAQTSTGRELQMSAYLAIRVEGD